MIIFVPAYDEATRANLAVAQELQAPHTAHCLLGHGAQRAALLRTLLAYGDPLFAMSHGKPDHLCAPDNTPALTTTDAAALGQRAVFAFACHTAASLGRTLAASGVTWWGYIKEVTAPDSSDSLRPLFVDIFRYIYETFASSNSSTARSNIITHIKQLCDSASFRIDQLAEADLTLDVFEAFQSLRDIWQLLRV